MVSCPMNSHDFRTSNNGKDKAHLAANVWTLARGATTSLPLLLVPEGRVSQGVRLRCALWQGLCHCRQDPPRLAPCATR